MKRPFLAVIFSLGLLLAAEVGLRLANFSYTRGASYMEFNFPRPHELHQIFEPDPALLWRLRPGYDFGQGFPKLNGQGFRGPDYAALPAAPFRVALLGDSVIFGRPESDPAALLTTELAGRGRPAQVLNFGVPGYSSWQGTILAARVAADYRPAVMIFLYGWNDHWLAKGFSDRDQRVSPAPSRGLRLLRGLRLYQFIDHARMHAARLLRPEPPRPPVLRVPPADYRQNLAALSRAARAAGAVPIITTAPSGISAGRIPDYLVAGAFIARPADLAHLHGQYNDLARAVAAETGAHLCDLDADFESRGEAEFFDDPEKDLIHPNAAGYRLLAEVLADCVQKAAPIAIGR